MHPRKAQAVTAANRLHEGHMEPPRGPGCQQLLAASHAGWTRPPSWPEPLSPRKVPDTARGLFLPPSWIFYFLLTLRSLRRLWLGLPPNQCSEELLPPFTVSSPGRQKARDADVIVTEQLVTGVRAAVGLLRGLRAFPRLRMGDFRRLLEKQTYDGLWLRYS